MCVSFVNLLNFCTIRSTYVQGIYDCCIIVQANCLQYKPIGYKTGMFLWYWDPLLSCTFLQHVWDTLVYSILGTQAYISVLGKYLYLARWLSI